MIPKSLRRAVMLLFHDSPKFMSRSNTLVLWFPQVYVAQ